MKNLLSVLLLVCSITLSANIAFAEDEIIHPPANVKYAELTCENNEIYPDKNICLREKLAILDRIGDIEVFCYGTDKKDPKEIPVVCLHYNSVEKKYGNLD